MDIIHNVKCVYCQRIFDRDKTAAILVGTRRYAHKECADKAEEQKVKAEQDRIALEEYIKKLFKTDYVDPKIQKMIKNYIDNYQFTYSGILKALKYWYDIKRNSIEKSNGSIGIVPYIYEESKRYYYQIWAAQQLNMDKQYGAYIPRNIEITIEAPKRKTRRSHKFDFLDDDEVDENEQ